MKERTLKRRASRGDKEMVTFTTLGSSKNGILMLAKTGLLWLQRNNCDYASITSTYSNTQCDGILETTCKMSSLHIWQAA